MKVTIFRQQKGDRPTAYEHFNTKKQAKQVLLNIWEHSIETDDTQTIAGSLTAKGTFLTLPNETKYYILQNQSL